MGPWESVVLTDSSGAAANTLGTPGSLWSSTADAVSPGMAVVYSGIALVVWTLCLAA